jgi:DNA-binding beta-propeller fold protein YncE
MKPRTAAPIPAALATAIVATLLLGGCSTAAAPRHTHPAPKFTPIAAPTVPAGHINRFGIDVTATEPLPAGTKKITVQKPSKINGEPGIVQLTATKDAVFGSEGLYRFSPSGTVTGPLTTTPNDHIAAAGSDLWTATFNTDQVNEFDETGKLLATVHFPSDFGPQDLAVTPDGGIWVTGHHGGAIDRIDPTTHQVTATIPMGQVGQQGPFGIALGAQSLWVGIQNSDELVRVDPQTDAIEAEIPAPGACAGVAVDVTSVWVAQCGDADNVERIDIATNQLVMSIGTGGATEDMAADQTGVWLVTGDDPDDNANEPGLLLHITDKGDVDHAYNLGNKFEAAGLVIAFGALWASDGAHPVVYRIPLPTVG